MVNIRLKILDKGRIVEEQLLRVLQRHEDALSNAEGSSYDDTEVKADITALETDIGDESTEGTILARIKALEDAQTPADP